MASLRLLALTFLSVFALSLVSCSNGGGGGSNNGENGKLSPANRWPETGSFQYDYTDSINGMSCHTSDFFARKSDYCVALTDREKNNGCALNARKNSYTNNCGTDFEETDIRGQDWIGWDHRLDKSCSTPHPFDNFKTLSAYCSFLKDEATHENCHWDDRAQEFKNNHCAGDFSQAPAFLGATPTPSPTPNVSPTPVAPPSPTPTPDTRPQVARDLEAAGIEVVIEDFNHMPPLPGQPSFQTSLANFWSTLDRVKNSLIAHQAVIKELHLTQYVTYNNQGQYLYMDVELNDSEVLAYLNQLDRRLLLQKEIGTNIELGIEVYGFEKGDKLADLKATLNTLESSGQDLARIKSAVSSINLDNYFGYSFYDRTLRVTKAKLATDITKAVKLLMPMTEFYSFVDNRHIELDMGTSMDLEVDGAAVANLMKKLMSAKDSLLILNSLKKLDKMAISTLRTETNYYDSLAELTPASAGPAGDEVSDVIDALANCYQLASSVKVKFAPDGYTLDSKIEKAAKRFKRSLATIKAKGSLIDTVTYGNTSSYSYKRLTIGTTDDDAAFDKVLQGIK